MAIHVSSPDFGDGQPIPVVHTGDGADRSPRLVIGEVPEAARSLALICDDPDAPTPQPWVHWIVYDLSPGIGQLPGGLPRNSRLCELGGAAQGKNSWGTLGYRGPAPPRGHGRHRYRFTVYALDLPPGLPDGLDKQALLESISAHVLASGQWQGTYQR